MVDDEKQSTAQDGKEISGNSNELVSNPVLQEEISTNNEAEIPQATFISQNPIPEPVTSMSSDEFGINDKKGKKWKIILGVVIGLIILGVGGFFIFKSVYMSNPYNIYKSAIDLGYEKYSDMLKEIKDSQIVYEDGESIKYDGSFKLNMDLDALGNDLNNEEKDLLNGLLDLEYNLKLGYDPKNTKGYIGLGVKEGNNEFLTANAYYINDAVYVNSKELYDKPVKVATKDEIMDALAAQGIDLSEYGIDDIGNLDIKSLVNSLLEVVKDSTSMSESEKSEIEDIFDDYQNPEINYDDLDELGKIIRDAIIDSLDKDRFSKNKDEIEINGKNTKVNTNSYKIDEEEAERLTESILKAIKGNDKAIEILSKTTGFRKEIIKEAIDGLLDSIDFSGMKEVEFVIYSKTTKVVGFAILYDEENVLDYVEDDEYFELRFGDKDTYFKAVKDKELKINLVADGENIMTITSKEENNSTVMSMIITAEGNSVALDVISTVDKKSDKLVSSSYDVTLTVNESGEEISMEFAYEDTIEYGANLDLINVNQAVNIDELTEEDQAKILENLEKALKDTELYSLIESLEEMESTADPMCDMVTTEDCECDIDGCICSLPQNDGTQNVFNCPPMTHDF